MFNTYTGENPPNFLVKGHNSKIKHLLWSSDDTLLISCGWDGFIYVNKITTEVLKIDERNLKAVKIECVAITQNQDRIYSIGSDRRLRLFDLE